MDLLAQITGLLGLIFLIIALQSNDKGELLKNQIIANVFYELQYIKLGAVAGAFMALVNLLRNIAFADYEKKSQPIPIKILFIFWLVIISLGILSYDSFYSIIPIIMTMISTYALWQDDMKKFRLLIAGALIGWIYYNLAVGAYVAFIGSVIELSVTINAINKFDMKHKKPKMDRYKVFR